MFDAERFCLDYRIDYAQRGRHYRPGWVNISCPMCSGSSGHHGGFHVSAGYYNCWRCGHHWLPRVVARLIGVDERVGVSTVAEYTTGAGGVPDAVRRQIEGAEFVRVPPSVGPMTGAHTKYLFDRGFDPDELFSEWRLAGTGPYGRFSNRVFVPITFRRKLVSYQMRDITDRASRKYLAAEAIEEVVPHQSIVYGFDHAAQFDGVVVVEGVTDVWKCGRGAVATFGIEWTVDQAWLIANTWQRVMIFFDPEPAAQRQALALAAYLETMGCQWANATDDEGRDPGEIPADEVRGVVKKWVTK